MLTETIAREKQHERQEGRQEGLLEGIALSLEIKFGEPGLDMMAELRQVHEPDRLREIARTLRSARTLAEFREALHTLIQ
jgi:hypothetical protein